MGNIDLLDETTRQWLEDIGIRALEVVDKSWPESDSQVSRVSSSDGRAFYVKRFASSVKFEQSVHAYQNWLFKLEGLVPRLVSSNLQHRLMLLTDVGGDCCDWQEFSAAQRASLLRQAGTFLRALHDTPFVDDDSMAVGDAVLARTRALQRRIRESDFRSDCLSPDLMCRIVDQIGEVVPQLNQVSRVPCHRDFWRRNWIWKKAEGDQPEGVHLAVLDFEHARPDLFFFDFMKLWSDCWLAHPQLEQPFWDGYGRSLTSEENTLLKRCAKVHAVQAVVWAAEHQNDAFLAQGERLLAATDAAC